MSPECGLIAFLKTGQKLNIFKYASPRILDSRIPGYDILFQNFNSVVDNHFPVCGGEGCQDMGPGSFF
jgi:hypothetical protein